jgi:hypothetical protein
MQTAEAASWTSAVASFAAVLVAIYMGLGTLNLTLRLKKEELNDQARERLSRRRALAAAIAEELFEVEVRLRRIAYHRAATGLGMLLMLFKDMADLRAPLLCETISKNLYAFEDADAVALGRLAAKIMKCHRFAEPTAQGILPLTPAVEGEARGGLLAQMDDALPSVAEIRARLYALSEQAPIRMTPEEVVVAHMRRIEAANGH